MCTYQTRVMWSNCSDMNPELHCGMIAVVGRANVGKSTLLNTILEEKVSIVSPVAQTTRNLVRGILTEPRGQLVFLDTPGVHKASYDLGKVMNRIARASVEGSDAVMLVLDASRKPQEEDEGWMRRLARENVTRVFVLNKTDAGSSGVRPLRETWEAVAAEREVPADTANWIEVSARTGKAVRELVSFLFDRMPAGPHLFPEDILTDFPKKLNIADVVRERFFLVLRDELPHALAVEIEEVDETPGGWTARGSILVEKNSQKGIVIGNKGRQLKKVRDEAEKELAEMYGHPVKLDLWVKVEPKWTRNFWVLKRLGYTT